MAADRCQGRRGGDDGGGGEWRQSRARGVAGWIENGVDGVDGVAAG